MRHASEQIVHGPWFLPRYGPPNLSAGNGTSHEVCRSETRRTGNVNGEIALATRRRWDETP